MFYEFYINIFSSETVFISAFAVLIYQRIAHINIFFIMYEHGYCGLGNKITYTSILLRILLLFLVYTIYVVWVWRTVEEHWTHTLIY